MRLLRPAILLSVVPLVPVPSAAQTVAQQITQLSADWMRAVWDKDDTVLNRVMADDFVLLSPGGSIKSQTRPDWLRSVRLAGNGECGYSNVHVQSIGSEMAIMAARMSCKGDFHGIGLEADSVVSDVWVKRDGTWRIAARVASTSPHFTGIWMPLLIGAALPLAAWCFFSIRAKLRARDSLLSSANRF